MGFVREAWPVLEPTQRFVGGWHLDAMADHLTALSKGTLGKQHLLANVPPGSMKSLMFSVMFPAWEWGPRGLAHFRYLSGSYEEGLAERDNRKMRRLIESNWFQDRWSVPLTKAGDLLFENAYGGTRWARAFNSMTGGRGNRVIIDDPHSTETAESPAQRSRTTRIFRESIQDRLNNQQTDSIIVVMQRLHAKDVSGVIEDLKLDFERLVIPMEFDPARRTTSAIGWRDPRAYDGELMCPERWGQDAVDKLKISKGAYAYAGQYQQTPTPRGGGLFKKTWFEGKGLKVAHPQTRWVRGWDLAATELATTDTRGARTAGVKIGRQPDGSFVIGHARAEGYDEIKAENLVYDTALADGKGVVIDLPQDPGAAGKTVKRAFISRLAGFVVFATPESGDKETRAMPFAVQCEAGNVYYLEGHWNEEYFEELSTFPNGARRDLGDASSRAFSRLIPRPGDQLDPRTWPIVAPMVIAADKAVEGHE